MPFTDVIDDYSDGATGTLTDAGGDSVNYTITSTSPNVDWNDLTGGARVSADGAQTFEIEFDQPIIGANIQFSGSDRDEHYSVVIDGSVVDLNSLIASGDVTFTQIGVQSHIINSDGSIAGGRYQDGNIAELVFNIPVTTISVVGIQGRSFDWDYVDVGIDSTVFDVVCFANGTSIATANGPHQIESLKVGDLLVTASGDKKPIRWIGSRSFARTELAAKPHLRPVRICAGALGSGLPKRDLLLSRQHRMVVSSKIADRMFGTTQVLIPAIKLTALPGIYVDESIETVEYFHILLDNHDTILAEGAPSESLFTGKRALGALSKVARDEIKAIFPEMEDIDFEPRLAMLVPDGKKQKQLVARHIKNEKPLLESF